MAWELSGGNLQKADVDLMALRSRARCLRSVIVKGEINGMSGQAVLVGTLMEVLRCLLFCSSFTGNFHPLVCARSKQPVVYEGSKTTSSPNAHERCLSGWKFLSFIKSISQQQMFRL